MIEATTKTTFISICLGNFKVAKHKDSFFCESSVLFRMAKTENLCTISNRFMENRKNCHNRLLRFVGLYDMTYDME